MLKILKKLMFMVAALVYALPYLPFASAQTAHVSTLSFDPPIAAVGSSATARFSGVELTDSTYFDVRFRAPGGASDEVAINWQLGVSGTHSIPDGTRPGFWSVTGVRAHPNRDDHTGEFDPVAPSLAVILPACLISTAAGEIQGLDLGASCAFLGVPYAAAPLGNLRWKPPQPSPRWSPSILFATSAPPACPSIANGLPLGAEDCLKLNIWTPKPVPIAPAPVIVWIHTGAFVAASANFAANNGEKIAAQRGVVVVAPNYRLGAFGFLAHNALTTEDPGYRSSGNYGFLDQRAALVWVRDNIAKFGGDPNVVTIGGQSAGAHSVSLHVVSPQSAGLFHRAVMESGYASTRWKTRDEAEVQGNAFAAALGCTNPSQVLSCLRSKSRDEVLRALPTAFRWEFLETAAYWSPVVDGLEIPDQPRLLYERADFNHVPILLGATRDEGWTFVDRSFPTGLTAAQYQAAIEMEFGSAAAAMLGKYPLQNFASPKEALAQLTGDTEYVCEAVRVARLVERTRMPVYLYSFEYVVDGLASNRVIHGNDTNFVFGNNFVAPFPDNRVLNAADLALSNSISGYWTRFAATGDPNSKKDDGVPHWTAFVRAGGLGSGAGFDPYLILDSAIREGTGLRQQQCDFLDPMFFRSVIGAVPASTP